MVFDTNQNLGGLSPRNYLRGKSWEEPIEIGKLALILNGSSNHEAGGFNWSAVGELVERFAAMGVAQNKALLWDEYAEFSRLYWQMDEIRNELHRGPEIKDVL